MILFCKLADKARHNRDRQGSYLRRQLTIFLRVHVMGCSDSTDFCQILSRVMDELNKLKKREHRTV